MRTRILRPARACAIAASIAIALLPALAHGQAPLSRQEQAEFLKTARVVSSVPIGKGVTKPQRLTLTNGTVTHDAAFQSVDQRREVSTRTGRGGKPELNFRDSWRYNVAAPRLAELIGIGDMVPVSVERTWRGQTGALTWWVDDVLMDDEARRKTNAEPPDREAWYRQQNRMYVFTELVYDTDRNQGNILITKDPAGPDGAGWRLVMIDFTRAFRTWKETRSPLNVLRRCDRVLLDAMRRLTEPAVREAVGEYLTEFEVETLLARRDLIVKHFDGLVATLGEERVLY